MVERKELILFFSKINKFSLEKLIGLVTASRDHFKLFARLLGCVKKRRSPTVFASVFSLSRAGLSSRDFHKQSWNNPIVTYALMWLWITMSGSDEWLRLEDQWWQLQRVQCLVSKQ